ncbi:MAG: type IV pilus modification protein PilV, partial [Gammaproteobacteria bacterium]|nr:type IV pilus modification protein PilV [Gammaproteobacteria bacterium]
ANKDGFDAGDYNNATGAQKTNCTNTTGCNAADMAVHDTWDWNQNLGATLPSGQGVVCLDSTPDDGITTAIACDGSGSIYAVKVWWDDDRTGTAADFQRFVTSFRP